MAMQTPQNPGGEVGAPGKCEKLPVRNLLEAFLNVTDGRKRVTAIDGREGIFHRGVIHGIDGALGSPA